LFQKQGTTTAAEVNKLSSAMGYKGEFFVHNQSWLRGMGGAGYVTMDVPSVGIKKGIHLFKETPLAAAAHELGHATGWNKLVSPQSIALRTTLTKLAPKIGFLAGIKEGTNKGTEKEGIGVTLASAVIGGLAGGLTLAEEVRASVRGLDALKKTGLYKKGHGLFLAAAGLTYFSAAASAVAVPFVGYAIGSYGRNSFSGKDDTYNTIEGLSEKGIAAGLRKQNTDFGSGYQGIGLFKDSGEEDVQQEFKWFTRALDKYGVKTGTGHKRILIPKGILNREELEEQLGFVPVSIAIPESGQTTSTSWRHPRLPYHLHEHGNLWTMHKDKHAAATMLWRRRKEEGSGPLGYIGDFFLGLPHVVTEGIPGAFYWLKGKILRGRDLAERVAEETPREYWRSLNRDMNLPNMTQFSGRDDFYNTIQGLNESGIAAILRKQNTDFGSGYQGNEQVHLYRGTKFSSLVHNPPGDRVFGLDPTQKMGERYLEEVRRQSFPDRPSRIGASFWTPRPAAASIFALETPGFIPDPTSSKIPKVYEAEFGGVSRVTRPSEGLFFAKPSLYNEFMNSVAEMSYTDDKTKEALSRKLAERYWQGVPLKEALDPSNLDVETFLHGRVEAEKYWKLHGRTDITKDARWAIKWKYKKDLKSEIAENVLREQKAAWTQTHPIRSFLREEGPRILKKPQTYMLSAAAILSGYFLFSGKDDDYNTIEGLRHGGMAGKTRAENTGFGSGWLRKLVGKIGSGVKSIFSRTNVYKELSPYLQQGSGRVLDVERVAGLARQTKSAEEFGRALGIPENRFVIARTQQQSEAVDKYIRQAAAGRAGVSAADVEGATRLSAGTVGAGEQASIFVKQQALEEQAKNFFLQREFKRAGITKRGTAKQIDRAQKKAERVFQESKEDLLKVSLYHEYLEVAALKASGRSAQYKIASHWSLSPVIGEAGLLQSLGQKDLAEFAMSLRTTVQERRAFAVGARMFRGNNRSVVDISGMDERGYKALLRHLGTPFGSKYDTFRSLAKAMGETFEQLISRKGVIQGLKSGRVVERLGQGSYGRAELMETTLFGKKVQYVRKTVTGTEESLIKGMRQRNPDADIDDIIDLVREGIAVRPGRNPIVSSFGVPANQGLDLTKEADFLRKLQKGEFYPSVYHATEKEMFLEFMPGKPLTGSQALQPKVKEATGRLISELAEANVVNRDLRPGNLLLDSTGRLSGIDLGLAKNAIQPYSAQVQASAKAYAKEVTASLEREQARLPARQKTPSTVGAVQPNVSARQHLASQRLEQNQRDIWYNAHNGASGHSTARAMRNATATNPTITRTSLIKGT